MKNYKNILIIASLILYTLTTTSCQQKKSDFFYHESKNEPGVIISDINWDNIYDFEETPIKKIINKTKPSQNELRKKEIELYLISLRHNMEKANKNSKTNKRLQKYRNNKKRDYEIIKGLSLQEYWKE